MNKELEEAKKHLEHEVKVYENNKEINQFIGGKLGEKQHKINKTLLNYIENSIPKKKVEEKIEELVKFVEVAGVLVSEDEVSRTESQIEVLEELLEVE